MSKILIIGNGFDLFHQLPTKYNHFVSIMETIENLQPVEDIGFEDLFGKTFKEKYKHDYDSITDKYNVEKIKFNNSKIKQIDELLKTNLWYRHFKNVCEIDTWIDFEMEVESILNQVSILLKSENLQSKKINQYRDVPINYNDFELFGIIELKYDNKEIISIAEKYLDKRRQEIKSKDIFSDLSKSFEEFIFMFNLYLLNVVSVFYKEINLKYSISFQLINEIYTFNYTPTLETVYNVQNSKVIYLHGKLNDNNVSQNIVLGISEVPTDIKNREVFAFTKYYQKVNKDSNPKFINIPEKKISGLNETIFYIIGHSLDESDKEYIFDLFKYLEFDLLKKSKICIFYYNNDDKENKIKNLFNIIDKEVIVKLNNDGRIYFSELSEENIKNEFERKTYKHEIFI